MLLIGAARFTKKKFQTFCKKNRKKFGKFKMPPYLCGTLGNYPIKQGLNKFSKTKKIAS